MASKAACTEQLLDSEIGTRGACRGLQCMNREARSLGFLAAAGPIFSVVSGAMGIASGINNFISSRKTRKHEAAMRAMTQLGFQRIDQRQENMINQMEFISDRVAILEENAESSVYLDALRSKYDK